VADYAAVVAEHGHPVVDADLRGEDCGEEVRAVRGPVE
jgi:hypothetical protein